MLSIVAMRIVRAAKDRGSIVMPKVGTLLAGGIVLVALLFGIGMWYAQQRSFYDPVEGLESVRIGDREFAVTGYEGTDGITSPLKLRGCFRLANPDAAIAAGRAATDAVPLTTPDWIECFDENAIHADIQAGRATAIMAGDDEGDGADLYMAIYPDGRAFQWRQPNAKYRK